MRRVLVIGPPGAGKSTLARALAAKLDLPVVHLDQLVWQSGWVQRDRAVFDSLLAAALAEPRWIIEGNYVRTLPLRLAVADTVIWLDFRRLICLTRVFWRTCLLYGRTRADMAPGCPERFDLEFFAYIWSFRAQERPRVTAAVGTADRHVRVIRLGSPAAAARFLSSLN